MEKWQVTFYADGEKMIECFWVNTARESALANTVEWCKDTGRKMGSVIDMVKIEEDL